MRISSLAPRASRSKHLRGFSGPVDAVYVAYQDRQDATEYYDIKKDRYEQHNTASKLTEGQRDALDRMLTGLQSCHRATTWNAASP